jgi:hypothetical protein
MAFAKTDSYLSFIASLVIPPFSYKTISFFSAASIDLPKAFGLVKKTSIV